MGLLDKLIRGSYKTERTELFPKTRTEVFTQLFRYHKRTLLNVSLMCALFALPTVAAVILSVLYKNYIPQFLADGSLTAPVADNIELSRMLLEMQVDRLVCLILIPTNAVLFVGIAGGLHVVQRAAWGENIEFFHDFGGGIKQNFKRYIFYAVVFGVALLFCVFVVGYYSVAEVHVAVKAISMAIAVSVLFVVTGVTVFALPHADVYKSPIVKEIKNSFIFFIVSFPINFGLLVLTAAPLALLLIPITVLQTIASIAITLFYPSLAILIWVLRSNALFDKYLNVGDNERIAEKGLMNDDGDGLK